MRNKLLFIVPIVTTLCMLGAKSYWFDEAFSLAVIKNPLFLHQLWVSEPNMWLYYFILRVWTYLGTGEFTVRLLSALFAIAATPFMYLLGKQLFTKKVGITATVLLSLHALFVFYAQDARSYALLLFLTLSSSYLFVRSLTQKKLFPVYIVLSTLSVYAHFYGGFVILSQLFFLILTKRWKMFFTSSIIAALLLLPYAISPSLHAGSVNWLPKPGIGSVIGTFFLLMGDFPLLIPVYAYLLVSIVSKRSWQHIYLLLWLLAPLVASFAISFIKPLYQSVYFIICVPPLLLLIAEALERQKNLVWKRSLLGLIIIFSLLRLGLWYTGSPLKWVLSNRNEDWRSATRYVLGHMQKNDRVIFYGYYGKEAFAAYGTAPSVEIASASYDLGAGSQLPEPNNKLITSFSYQHIFLVLNRNTGTEFNRTKQAQEVVADLEKHYHLVKTDTFYKVTIEEFSL